MFDVSVKPNYKVYDPIGKVWSIDWVLVYDKFGRAIEWLPVWPK